MKLIGYLSAGLGLVSILFSSGNLHDSISLIKSIPSKYLLIAGAVLIVLGIVILIGFSSGSSVKHASEEVPIYEGQGKNRKIVGYQRAAK